MNERIFSIVELKRIRELKKELCEKEEDLSSPMLKDVNLIPEIYGWFMDIYDAKHLSLNVNSVLQRKEFLFIVLLLYSPKTLAGGRMSSGLRKEISKIYPNILPCVISNNISNLYLIYKQYKDTRLEIEDIYNEIASRLKLRDLL